MLDEQLQRDEWVGTPWPPAVATEPPAQTEPMVIAPDGIDAIRQRREVLERRAFDALDRLLAEG